MKVNPCRHCGKEPQESTGISRHIFICVPCNNSVTGTHYDAALALWNSENPNQKIVYRGTIDYISYTHDVVLRQVPALPAPHTPILLWIGTRWLEARYNGHGLWVYDAIYGYSREVKDGHYWMELPSFNPEENNE